MIRNLPTNRVRRVALEGHSRSPRISYKARHSFLVMKSKGRSHARINIDSTVQFALEMLLELLIHLEMPSRFLSEVADGVVKSGSLCASSLSVHLLALDWVPLLLYICGGHGISRSMKGEMSYLDRYMLLHDAQDATRIDAFGPSLYTLRS